jgi:hypothetical protein
VKHIVRSMLVVAVAVVASSPGQAKAAVYPFVQVPSRYVYDPSQGSLHDYCTKSPDSWGRADFRGPCANHDLCYMDHVRGKQSCDDSLRTDMEMTAASPSTRTAQPRIATSSRPAGRSPTPTTTG